MRAALICLLALTGSAAQAQGYGPAITLEQARRVAAAAEADARAANDRMVIAVVEPNGQPVLFQKMDGAIYAAVVIAQEKAKTAAAFRQPTANFENGVKESPFILCVPGMTPIEGGVPIVVEGRVIGAIGVSGSSPADDGRSARAGAAAAATPAR